MSCHFVILSRRLALPGLYNGGGSSFGDKHDFIQVTRVGTAWLPPRYRTSCLADGEVRDEGKSLEGSKSLKLSL